MWLHARPRLWGVRGGGGVPSAYGEARGYSLKTQHVNWDVRNIVEMPGYHRAAWEE